MRKHLLPCLLLVACAGDDAGTGSLSVLLEPEDSITVGMDPGDEGENIRDGWAVRFDRYVVTVGDIDLHFATDQGVRAEAPEIFSVDLTEVDAAGAARWALEGLREGRWAFHFATPGAAEGALRDDGVPPSVFDDMVVNDWTYFIDGTLSKAGGESCPPASLATVADQVPTGNMSGDDDCYAAPSVRFTFGVPAEARLGPCEIDGVPGVAIAAEQTQTAAITLHGDHLFFNGFPTGNEGGVMRLAQWLADCDLDLDGSITAEELQAIVPSALPELDPERYQLGGAPIALRNMYDYVGAQLMTQGHFQGEGECALDGAVGH